MAHYVLPGHAEGGFMPDTGLNGNYSLRIGEVQAIYYPEDRQNVSKMFIEYKVLVQHKANGTGVTKSYDHVLAIDHLGGIADYSYSTFRADNAATKVEGKFRKPGKGARVLLLCINGESQNAVIIGGIRNPVGPKDKKESGHHAHHVFNGVDIEVNKDGEFTLTRGGASKVDGTLAQGVKEESTGTFVKFDKDGNVTVSDKSGENKIVLDHVNGKMQVFTKTEIDLVSPKVRQGDAETSDPAVGGNELKQILTDLISAINALTVPTANGPSGTPINAQQFSAVQAKLQTMLSKVVFLKM
jgi:hypothetical protein